MEAMEKWMGPAEVAEVLNCSQTHVTKMARRGELPMVRFGERWRITPSALREWYDSLTKSAQVQQKRA